MLQKEEIEQFRRDLKSVRFWARKVREINLELEAVEVQKTGVSSPNYQSPKLENVGDPMHPYNYQLAELERQLLKVRNKFTEKIVEVENRFELIDDEVDKKIIFDIYILNEKYSKVADRYCYAESTIFDRISKTIVRIM